MLEAIMASIRYRVCPVPEAHVLKLGRLDTYEERDAHVWL